jgi:hypothetical protein
MIITGVGAVPSERQRREKKNREQNRNTQELQQGESAK